MPTPKRQLPPYPGLTPEQSVEKDKAIDRLWDQEIANWPQSMKDEAARGRAMIEKMFDENEAKKPTA